MEAIHPGRYSAEIEGDFVVFLIGMRLNRPWKVHRWLPVYVAMPRMLRQLQRDPERGLLGAGVGLLFDGPAVVQYWRSFEHLERFARDPAATRPSTAACPASGWPPQEGTSQRPGAASRRQSGSGPW